MRFNIDDLENNAKYGDFVRNVKGLVVSCTVQDNDGNIAYVKNLIWDEKQATNWMLQDKAEQPTEIIVMERDFSNHISIVQTITNLIYGANKKAVSFLKTDALGQQFLVYDIEYDEFNRINYCKQKDKSGNVREFTDFEFDENGEFVNCENTIMGNDCEENFSKGLLKKVYKSVDINNLMFALTGKDINDIDKDEKAEILQRITQIIQILDSLKNTQVYESKENLKENDILTPKYKLITPLLQVFYSMDTAQEYIAGEKNLTEIISNLNSKYNNSMHLSKETNHVLNKIANNLSKIIFNENFGGNYQFSNIGKKLIDLGFKLEATNQNEALDYAIRHLYFNADNLLNEDVILSYHYKKLDNFILVKL
ncbi:MAG: hypothetical protein MJ180_05175 [Candidatus Gastranaerophilales bacterium]|nr:hypothetical protein [Candidatus Gastranaerophilales bacterium]